MDAPQFGDRWTTSQDPLAPLGGLARLTLYAAIIGMLAAFVVAAASGFRQAQPDAAASTASAPRE